MRIHGENGFTLLESALAIIVIGMLAVIGIPKILPTHRRVAEIAAQQITADMRYARSLAITNSEEHEVRFYPADGTEYSEYKIFPASASNELNPIKSGEIEEDKIDCVDLGLINDTLTFTELGRIDGAPGDASGNIIQITGGAKTLTIGIVVATGMISFD